MFLLLCEKDEGPATIDTISLQIEVVKDWYDAECLLIKIRFNCSSSNLILGEVGC